MIKKHLCKAAAFLLMLSMSIPTVYAVEPAGAPSETAEMEQESAEGNDESALLYTEVPEGTTDSAENTTEGETGTEPDGQGDEEPGEITDDFFEGFNMTGEIMVSDYENNDIFSLFNNTFGENAVSGQNFFDTVNSSFDVSNVVSNLEIINNTDLLSTVDFDSLNTKYTLVSMSFSDDFALSKQYNKLQNAESLFAEINPEVYSMSLKEAKIPDGFDAFGMLNTASEQLTAKFDTATDSGIYKKVNSMLDTANIYDKSNEQIKMGDLLSTEDLAGMLTGKGHDKIQEAFDSGEYTSGYFNKVDEINSMKEKGFTQSAKELLATDSTYEMIQSFTDQIQLGDFASNDKVSEYNSDVMEYNNTEGYNAAVEKISSILSGFGGSMNNRQGKAVAELILIENGYGKYGSYYSYKKDFGAFAVKSPIEDEAQKYISNLEMLAIPISKPSAGWSSYISNDKLQAIISECMLEKQSFGANAVDTFTANNETYKKAKDKSRAGSGSDSGAGTNTGVEADELFYGWPVGSTINYEADKYQDWDTGDNSTTVTLLSYEGETISHTEYRTSLESNTLYQEIIKYKNDSKFNYTFKEVKSL